jgi:hypothetical protein
MGIPVIRYPVNQAGASMNGPAMQVAATKTANQMRIAIMALGDRNATWHPAIMANGAYTRIIMNRAMSRARLAILIAVSAYQERPAKSMENAMTAIPAQTTSAIAAGRMTAALGFAGMSRFPAVHPARDRIALARVPAQPVTTATPAPKAMYATAAAIAPVRRRQSAQSVTTRGLVSIGNATTMATAMCL